MNKNKKRFLIWIPFSLLLVYTLCMVGYEAIVSFSNYKAMRGIADSEFVGLKNYERILNYRDTANSFFNSFGQTLMYMLPALGLGMLLSFLLGLIPSRKVKSALAGAALLTALIPTIVLEQGVVSFFNDAFAAMRAAGFNDVPLNALVDSTASLFISTIVNMIPQLALVVFAGLSLSISTGMSPWKGALIAGLLPMMTLFTPNMAVTRLVSNTMNMQVTNTMPLLVYKYGLQNMQISYSTAISTLVRFANLFASVLPMLLIALFVKSDAKNLRVREEKHSWGFEMLIAFGVTLTLAAMYLLAQPAGNMDRLQTEPAVITVAVGFMALIVGFLLLFLIIALSRHAAGKTSFVFALMLVMLTMISNYLISGYMAIRNLGMLNTAFSVVFGAMANPVFLTILVLLLLQRPANMRQALFLTLGGAFLLAACAMGDYLPGLMTTQSTNARPLSTTLYLQINTAVQGNASTIAEVLNASKFILLLSVALAAVPGVTFVMGGVGGVDTYKD